MHRSIVTSPLMAAGARASTTRAVQWSASRSIDADGGAVRDDEVFEDGSRKAYGK
ncbi:MAG: hypothetical protein ABI281_05095 [Caldimonas sp.]